MTKSYRIAVLPGDGIGPEIVGEAVKVLKAVGKRHNIRFELHEALIGGASIDRYGIPLIDETLKLAKDNDAV